MSNFHTKTHTCSEYYYYYLGPQVQDCNNDFSNISSENNTCLHTLSLSLTKHNFHEISISSYHKPMEISVDGVLKARQFPFIFSFFILLLFLLISFLFLSDTQSQIPVRYDLTTPETSFIIKSSTTPPTPTPTVSQPPPSSFNTVVTGVSENATTEVADLKWTKCTGPVAFDYIPCLDNFKVMKKLKGKRRMERKERHCPQPSPRCLIPLPKGYKIPVLWPMSRDRVR